jgi:hypothetical protein
MILECKDFYIVRLDADDIPKGIIAGPFWMTEQASEAIEALQPLYPNQRLAYVGGNLIRMW